MAKRVTTIIIHPEEDASKGEVKKQDSDDIIGFALKTLNVDEAIKIHIKESFYPAITQLKEWKMKAYDLVVTGPDQKEQMDMARQGRLTIKTHRNNADKLRKAMKEDSIAYGKAVQNVYNVIEGEFVAMEDHLEKQEKFIELQRAQEVSRLQSERINKIIGLEEFIPININFGEMDQEDFDKLLSGAVLQKREREENAVREAQAKAQKEHLQKVREVRLSQVRRYMHLIPEVGHDPVEAQIMDHTDAEFFDFISSLQEQQRAYDQEQLKIREQNDLLLRQQQEQQASIKLQNDRLNILLPYAAFGHQIDMTQLHLLSEEGFNYVFSEKRNLFQLDQEAKKSQAYAPVNQHGSHLQTGINHGQANIPAVKNEADCRIQVSDIRTYLLGMEYPEITNTQDPNYEIARQTVEDVRGLILKVTNFIKDRINQMV